MALLRYVVFGVLGALELHTSAEFTCKDNNDCLACVSNNSTTEKCYWCPRDNKCYTEVSNDHTCKMAEKITETSHCSDELSTYDPVLSYKMLLLSAVAYDRLNPQECLDHVLPDDRFIITSVVTSDCDMSDSKCSGYVAVSHQTKSIAVVFRGSTNLRQALLQFLQVLVVPKSDFISGKVQYYWKKSYDMMWPCIKQNVLDLKAQYPYYKVWVTGHSLGGTLASMASAELAYEHIPRKDVIMYTFGMPRLGNKDYANFHDQHVNNSWRVVNFDDRVPHFPDTALSTNHHHGIEVFYTQPAADPYTGYKECHGLPHNEDESCSDGENFSHEGFDHHTEYFGIRVGKFCRDERRKNFSDGHRKHESDNIVFEYIEDGCSIYKYNQNTTEYFKVAAMSSIAVGHCFTIVNAIFAVASLYLAW